MVYKTKQFSTHDHFSHWLETVQETTQVRNLQYVIDRGWHYVVYEEVSPTRVSADHINSRFSDLEVV